MIFINKPVDDDDVGDDYGDDDDDNDDNDDEMAVGEGRRVLPQNQLQALRPPHISLSSSYNNAQHCKCTLNTIATCPL